MSERNGPALVGPDGWVTDAGMAEREAVGNEAIAAYDRCFQRIAELEDERLIDLWDDYHKALFELLDTNWALAEAG